MPKGYYTNFSYMGFVPWLKRYIPFASREEYVAYISENDSKGEDDEH